MMRVVRLCLNVHRPAVLIHGDDDVIISVMAMHHIYCEKKKGVIIDEAMVLRLGGCYAFGKPGRVIVEGRAGNVLRYERNLRGLRWQKMQVMGRIAVDNSVAAAVCHRSDEPGKLFCFQEIGLMECESAEALSRKLCSMQLLHVAQLADRSFAAPRTL